MRWNGHLPLCGYREHMGRAALSVQFIDLTVVLFASWTCIRIACAVEVLRLLRMMFMLIRQPYLLLLCTSKHRSGPLICLFENIEPLVETCNVGV